MSKCNNICWNPNSTRTICNTLLLTISVDSASGEAVYNFFAINLGDRPVTNVTISVEFTGNLSGSDGWVVNGNRAIYNFGTLGISEIILPTPLLQFEVFTPSSVNAIITSNVRNCDPSFSIANASFPSPMNA